MARKKLTKSQRHAKRVEHADNYKSAFDHGFSIGIQVGRQQEADRRKSEQQNQYYNKQ